MKLTLGLFFLVAMVVFGEEVACQEDTERIDPLLVATKDSIKFFGPSLEEFKANVLENPRGVLERENQQGLALIKVLQGENYLASGVDDSFRYAKLIKDRMHLFSFHECGHKALAQYLLKNKFEFGWHDHFISVTGYKKHYGLLKDKERGFHFEMMLSQMDPPTYKNFDGYFAMNGWLMIQMTKDTKYFKMYLDPYMEFLKYRGTCKTVHVADGNYCTLALGYLGLLKKLEERYGKRELGDYQDVGCLCVGD